MEGERTLFSKHRMVYIILELIAVYWYFTVQEELVWGAITYKPYKAIGKGNVNRYL